MKVRATEKGFYQCLREVGDEFDVPNGAKAPWWEAVDSRDSDKQSRRPAASSSQGKTDDDADVI